MQNQIIRRSIYDKQKTAETYKNGGLLLVFAQPCIWALALVVLARCSRRLFYGFYAAFISKLVDGNPRRLSSGAQHDAAVAD